MHDGDELNHDNMDDGALDALRRALSDVHTPGPPPLEAIAAKARAVRRRRRSGVAAVGSAAAVVAITAAVLAAPGHSATTHLGSGPVHVNLADFSVDSNADGTVRLDLSARQALDAPQLAGVLAQAGVPAVVRVGAFCGAAISPSGLRQAVVNVVARNSSAAGAQVAPQREGGRFLIRPSAIPKNAEISIGYSPDQVTVGLVAANRPLTCVVDRAVKCAELPTAGAGATTLPAPADTAPADTAPAGTAPAGTAPAGTAPAGTAPAGTAPAGTAPAGTAPAGTAPAGTAPAGTAPAGTAPAGTASAPPGNPSPGATKAVGAGGLTWSCVAQVLQPSAYAATTTTGPAPTTTTT